MKEDRVLTSEELNIVRLIFKDLVDLLKANNLSKEVSFYGDKKYLYLKTENFLTVYYRDSYGVAVERYLSSCRKIDTQELSRVLLKTMNSLGKVMPWSVNTVYFSVLGYTGGILKRNPKIKGYFDIYLE